MLHLNRETVGWFFVRDLQLDWRLAAEWFESRLIDYDCVLNWGNWVYFVLTQLPAREDDRPGGGPRFTLPKYSPFLSASQVIVWASEHDPTAGYVKKWLPQLKGLPPELAREPWRLKSDDDNELAYLLSTEDGAAAWACTTCTLENPLARRSCEACGARRSQIAVPEACLNDLNRNPALGTYSQPPIVPPPPGYESMQDVCSNCGQLDAGCTSEDGEFFCEVCWNSWMQSQSSALESPQAIVTETPIAETPENILRGWKLVPEHALPRSAKTPAADDRAEEQQSSPTAIKHTTKDRKKSGRWAVRGEKSSLTNQAIAERA
jgi:hypothetical protein